jgi:hypothetical protein
MMQWSLTLTSFNQDTTGMLSGHVVSRVDTADTPVSHSQLQQFHVQLLQLFLAQGLLQIIFKPHSSLI